MHRDFLLSLNKLINKVDSNFQKILRTFFFKHISHLLPIYMEWANKQIYYFGITFVLFTADRRNG